MRQNFTYRSVILNTFSTLYNDVQYGGCWIQNVISMYITNRTNITPINSAVFNEHNVEKTVKTLYETQLKL